MRKNRKWDNANLLGWQEQSISCSITTDDYGKYVRDVRGKQNQGEKMFVVYENGNEVIVTTEKKDSETIKEYFEDGKRDINEYDRHTTPSIAIRVLSAGLRWRD